MTPATIETQCGVCGDAGGNVTVTPLGQSANIGSICQACGKTRTATIETVEQLDEDRVAALIDDHIICAATETWDADQLVAILHVAVQAIRAADERAGLVTETAARVKAMEAVIEAAMFILGDASTTAESFEYMVNVKYIVALQKAVDALPDGSAPR